MSDKYKDIFFLCNFWMHFLVNFFMQSRVEKIEGVINVVSSDCRRMSRQVTIRQIGVVKTRTADSSLIQESRLLIKQIKAASVRMH